MSSAFAILRQRSSRWRPRAGTVAKVLMLAPALGMFLLFYFAALIASVMLSLYRWNGLEPRRFVGLDNYRELLTIDPTFMSNIKVSLLAAAVCVVCILPLALLLAVCLSGQGRLLPLFRAILFVPVVLPLTATALLWSEFFTSTPSGLANEVLGVFGFGPVSWLGDSDVAPWTLILISVWTLTGLHVVVQLSALSAIPTELKEAARLETSSPFRVFRRVILPLMRESLTVSAVLIVTGTFVFFTALAFIVTLGGPNHATEVLGLRAYIDAFSSGNFGRASAVTVISMLITVFVVGSTLLIGSRKRVEY